METNPIGCARRCLRSPGGNCTSFTFSESSGQCVISAASPGELLLLLWMLLLLFSAASPDSTCPVHATDSASCPREETIKVLMKTSKWDSFEMDTVSIILETPPYIKDSCCSVIVPSCKISIHQVIVGFGDWNSHSATLSKYRFFDIARS